MAESLGRLLARSWRQYHLSAEVIVPVPLGRQRLQERGYNQAALLAEALAARVAASYAPEILRRTRDTASQINLGWRERQTNVAGAFETATDGVTGKTIVLVDDVCTTGATLNACAWALSAAGAAEVKAITLARARWEAGL